MQSTNYDVFGLGQSVQPQVDSDKLRNELHSYAQNALKVKSLTTQKKLECRGENLNELRTQIVNVFRVNRHTQQHTTLFSIRDSRGRNYSGYRHYIHLHTVLLLAIIR